MRAPGAATGVYALECAMDELAVALKLDPLELRLRCYSDRDQNEDIPYTSKELRECYRQGAQAFGWDKRIPEPGSMRDGSELVGWGMATGIWEALQVKTAVRIALTANGHAEVACATSDIGTGTYTIMAQMTADMLGLPLENITVKLGDSTLPHAPVEGGSWTAASVSHAIARTSDEVRKELLRLAKMVPDSPLAPATGRRRPRGRQDRQQRRPTARCRSLTRCATVNGSASSGRSPPTSKTTPHMRETRTRRSSRR
jgi:xanthine dehydrogenase YagR molybdenum-binding subunit